MDQAWINRVLGDCADFARANALEELEAACRRAARIAESEMFTDADETSDGDLGKLACRGNS